MELLLRGPESNDPTQVGHKFARQYEMRRAGLPVPSFFCLSAAAFEACVPSAAGFPGPAAPTAELAAWAVSVREQVRAGGVPGDLAARVRAELAGQEGLFAVRACVAAAPDGAGEDSADDPFAGLSDSFLYVDRDTVAARIADCWASAYNPEAVLYRVRRGVDPTAVRVAVGVQHMVPGVRSFVVFTRDPRTGADRRVIAAAHGIGEGVVQEKADIDHFFVDGPTGAIEVRPVVKSVMIGLDQDRPTAGPTTLPVPAGLADAPVLTDADVLRVCALAAETERLFGGPQDVEGTITDGGEVFLVQARPVVAVDTRTGPPPRARRPSGAAVPTGAPWSADAQEMGAQAGARSAGAQAAGTQAAGARPTGPRIPWTNHNLTESFPGLTSPLTYSQARVFYRMGFTDFYRRLGVSPRSLRRNQHHLSRMIGYLDGRVYYRLDAWFTLHAQIPGFALMRPMWERSLGLTERAGPPRPAASRTWPGVLAATPRLAWTCAAHPWRLRRFLRWWDGLMADSAAFGDRTDDELVARYRSLWAQAAQRWGVTMVSSYFALGALTLADALLKRWVPDGAALLPRLLAGGKPNRTLASVRSAIALAERVGARPALRTAVLERPEREVWAEITAGRHGADVAEEFGRHLATYGDRALHDLKLEVLTPRQEPWRILTTLRPFVIQGLTVEANVAAGAGARRQAGQALREACPNPLRRVVLGTLLASLRAGVKAREDTRFCRSQLYGVSRDVLWRLADRLVTAGVLDGAADIVHLQVEEVLGAFDGTLPETDLRAVVSRRKAESAGYADRPDLPAYFTLPAGVPVAVALAEQHVTTTDGELAQDGVLRGLASSSGKVRARALVVEDASVSPQSCVDRVLVAKETDPGWLALMMAAKGMVVERGSLVSHTAISGRLLGIPTVVAVPHAMTLIPDGSWVELDGDAGTVRLLSGPGPEDSADGSPDEPAAGSPGGTDAGPPRTAAVDLPVGSTGSPLGGSLGGSLHASEDT
ncbi:PEP/pyruvate-binding domain-containing protein [Actinacidiphila sp. ITFR-21]|uniref:PEP/pyruvate-binding domain-containing protein n=1 Tax=Actinacidiphila sp. ITFR-21 TaxID=3075199 RepID=UPI00288A1C87|nr:PEP/pyruvate-binding domain-containing protein [Streptomyces sp. ITFR-21]WNI19665.1 PEP/pyruvate-binding domain-containing protein [Streptomyces sp. ITFR-21]